MAGAVNKPKNGKGITRAQYYSKNSHIKVIDDKTETHHTFDVSFYTDIIRTTVTPETSIVDEWIKRVYAGFHCKLEDGNNLIVGLDIEWVRLRERSKVAILQLCLAHQCLIFQFLGLPEHEVPKSLIDFLNDDRIIFVGSGIDQDANKLWIDYGLNVARREDLAGLSDYKLGTKDLYQSGLQFLMWKVLGKNLHKPKALTLSRWDFDFLTNQQVAYACLDAYASFKLGMKLMHRPRTVNKQGFNRQPYVHMMGDSSSFSTTKKDGLPEDVLVDIFQRLSIKSICKFMCLSKVWLSNLSEYMHTKFKTLENEPWAIFSKNRKSTQLMSSCPELSGYDGFSFSFLSESYSINAQDHKLYILASTNGLVLCSVVHECTGIGRYFVCNPITKESVSLPPPPKNNSVREFSYGLVCDTHSHSPAVACESAFKVVRTQNSLISDNRLKIEIYFSDLDEWRTYDVANNQQRKGTRDNVITHNGVVYWIEEGEPTTNEWEAPINRVVCYDLNTMNNYECDSHAFDVLHVPIVYRHLLRQRASSECIGVFGGFFCYGHIRKNALRIWKLDKNLLKNYYDSHTESGWDLMGETELPDYLEDAISILGFSPTDYGVVILAFEDQIFAFDVTTVEPDLEDVLCEPSSENSFNPFGKSEFLHNLCVPSSKNSFTPEVLHSKGVRSGKSYWKTQHYSPIIIMPTLTTISKAKKLNPLDK